MSKLSRGALIVFEGLDRSGKSTQSKKLVENLRKHGLKAEFICFPDRSTPIGKIIGEYLSNKHYQLDDKALHLLFTANRFEKVAMIKQLLYDNVNVVVDRYSFSGIVFSTVKKGMDLNWCKNPESGLPSPDVVYFLDLNLEEMKTRPGFGSERYENLETQLKVLEEYKKLSKAFSFRHINANQDIEKIGEEILEDSLRTIDLCKFTQLKYLNFLS